MIVSYSPGRIRLRFKELKNSQTAEAASARLKSVPGITGVEVKALTGSILIEYDPALLPEEKLFEMGKAELAKSGIKLELPG